MTVILDRVEDIDLIWPALEPWFDEAHRKAGTDFPPTDLFAAAKGGRVSLWAIYEDWQPIPLFGALATALADDGQTCRLVYFAGRDLNLWLPGAFAQLEALAVRNGVRRMEVTGRKGWARRLAQLGFKVIDEYGAPKRVRLEKRYAVR